MISVNSNFGIFERDFKFEFHIFIKRIKYLNKSSNNSNIYNIFIFKFLINKYFKNVFDFK